MDAMVSMFPGTRYIGDNIPSWQAGIKEDFLDLVLVVPLVHIIARNFEDASAASPLLCLFLGSAFVDPETWGRRTRWMGKLDSEI